MGWFGSVILGGVERNSWLLPVWDLPDLLLQTGARSWSLETEIFLVSWGTVRTLALRELCRGCCRARSVGKIGLEQVCIAQLFWGCELWKLRLPSSLIDKLAAYSGENHFVGVQIQFFSEMNLFKLLGQLPVFQWITPVTYLWLGVIYTDRIFICAAAIYCCMCCVLLGWETVLEQCYSASVIGKHVCCSLLFITNITCDVYLCLKKARMWSTLQKFRQTGLPWCLAKWLLPIWLLFQIFLLEHELLYYIILLPSQMLGSNPHGVVWDLLGRAMLTECWLS